MVMKRNSAKTKNPPAETEEIRVRRMQESSKKYFYTKKGRAYHLRRGAKHRAKKRNLPFDLTQEWILDRLEIGVCELTGIPFTFTPLEEYGQRNNCQPYSPTLDREISELGYVESNLRVVVAVYNYAKMHWEHEHVMNMARRLVNKEKGGENSV